MVMIRLGIEADLCGPVSVGTASVVRALMTHLGLSLDDACTLVNRCVFDSERVTFSMASHDAANALLAALSHTPVGPRVSAFITSVVP